MTMSVDDAMQKVEKKQTVSVYKIIFRIILWGIGIFFGVLYCLLFFSWFLKGRAKKERHFVSYFIGMLSKRFKISCMSFGIGLVKCITSPDAG